MRSCLSDAYYSATKSRKRRTLLFGAVFLILSAIVSAGLEIAGEDGLVQAFNVICLLFVTECQRSSVSRASGFTLTTTFAATASWGLGELAHRFWQKCRRGASDYEKIEEGIQNTTPVSLEKALELLSSILNAKEKQKTSWEDTLEQFKAVSANYYQSTSPLQAKIEENIVPAYETFRSFIIGKKNILEKDVSALNTIRENFLTLKEATRNKGIEAAVMAMFKSKGIYLDRIDLDKVITANYTPTQVGRSRMPTYGSPVVGSRHSIN